MWVDGWVGVYAFMHEPPLKDLHNKQGICTIIILSIKIVVSEMHLEIVPIVVEVMENHRIVGLLAL